MACVRLLGLKKIYFNLFSSLGKLLEPTCDNQLSHEPSKNLKLFEPQNEIFNLHKYRSLPSPIFLRRGEIKNF